MALMYGMGGPGRRVTGTGRLLTLIAAFFIGGIFAAVGTWMVGSQLHALHTWLPIKAHVFHHNIRSDDSGDSDTTYAPRVWYTYTVRGRKYTSHRAIYGSESAGYSWAEAIVNQFPVGQTCTAYYNPQDPTQAFLVHKMDKLIWIFPCIGYLTVLIGVVGLTVMCVKFVRAPRPVA